MILQAEKIAGDEGTELLYFVCVQDLNIDPFDDLEILTFQPWDVLHEQNPPSFDELVGTLKAYVAHTGPAEAVQEVCGEEC